MCRLLKGFSTAVSAIVHVTPQFDEPYCSTVPECEFQILYGRQLIRFRTQTPQEKADWIAALGGQPPCPPCPSQSDATPTLWEAMAVDVALFAAQARDKVDCGLVHAFVFDTSLPSFSSIIMQACCTEGDEH